MNWTFRFFWHGCTLSASSKLVVERDRFRIPGDALLGDGSNFCHGFFFSDCFGVVSKDPSGLGDINWLLGLELEHVDAVEGDPPPPLFLDISKSRAPLELKTEVRAFGFLRHGKGGLIND